MADRLGAAAPSGGLIGRLAGALGLRAAAPAGPATPDRNGDTQRLLRAYMETNGGKTVYGRPPRDTPEGQAALSSPPSTQIELVHALLAVVTDPISQAYDPAKWQDPGWQSAWDRHMKARGLLVALLRRKHEYSAEDVGAILGRLAGARDPWAYVVPAADVLRSVGRVAGPGDLSPAQRAALAEMRGKLGDVLRARGDRHRAEVALDALLGAETAAPAVAPLPPQRPSDPIALRDQAGEAYRRYLSLWRPGELARGRATGPEPDADPGLRPLLRGDAPARLALLETAMLARVRHSEAYVSQTESEAPNAVMYAVLGLLENDRASEMVADVGVTLERLAAEPRLWPCQWYVQPAIGWLMQRIEQDRLAEHLCGPLQTLRDAGAPHTGYLVTRQLIARIDRLLGRDHDAPIEAVDDFGYAARAAVDAMTEVERAAWIPVLRHAREATGARPSARWLKKAEPLAKDIGREVFTALVGDWLDLLDAGPAVSLAPPAQPYGVLPSAVPSEANAAILKGLAWLATLGDVQALAPRLATAAARCFKKVPGSGPRAVGAGNACLYALGTLPPLEVVQHVQWVKQRVTYLPALKGIDAILEDAAGRAGLQRDDLEDLVVPTLGLEDGRVREELGDYAGEVSLSQRGEVLVRWYRGETLLKSEPAGARKEHPDEVKALKATADELRKQVPIQRDRLERALMTGREWAIEEWRSRCLDHPLVSNLARRLIWRFEADSGTWAGAWDGERLVDALGEPLPDLPARTRVRLWHPIQADPGTAFAWRTWIERREVVQPFKQAHREIYLLTDAERQTRTYSNRFAGHILRQHQMHALAQQRGWKAPLAMVYDGGWNAELTHDLPAWGLRVHYFVEGVLDQGDAGYNDNGVCLLVSTDQVRFTRAGAAEPVPLDEVQALAFSEALRDVDLFVGVSSVGADPTWFDQGPDLHRRYWLDYAFGELNESARTRKAVLEAVLPRLTALDGRWSLEDRYLVVRGDVRTYKIHLGSGNIRMAPDDAYLCIVPARGEALASGTQFLPFEGDAALAIILSKALLLARDTAITDPTIVRQIRR